VPLGNLGGQGGCRVFFFYRKLEINRGNKGAGEGRPGIYGNPRREEDLLGLQRDLGAVVAGKSRLNRNGLRQSRNPSMERKATAPLRLPLPQKPPKISQK